jgi:hypothetical protein
MVSDSILAMLLHIASHRGRSTATVLFTGSGDALLSLGRSWTWRRARNCGVSSRSTPPPAKAVDKAYEVIGELELSFAAVVELWREQDPCPAFPTNAADKMGMR